MYIFNDDFIIVFRLEETAKRLRDNRKRKFEKWEERTNDFDLFLSAAERDIRSSDAIGDDMATVKKHNEEFKVCLECSDVIDDDDDDDDDDDEDDNDDHDDENDDDNDDDYVINK